MTSATEHLRALLDERGVEYKTDDRQIVRYTDWGQWFFAEPLDAEPNTLGAQCELVCMPVTPEQAIDATLGRGECEVECFDDGIDEGMDGEWFAYATATWHLSCGHEVYGSERPSYCSTCGKRVVEP